MIDIRVRSDGNKIESSYDLSGVVVLSDVALAICEIEKMKLRLLDESENCDPDIYIDKKP